MEEVFWRDVKRNTKAIDAFNSVAHRSRTCSSADRNGPCARLESARQHCESDLAFGESLDVGIAGAGTADYRVQYRVMYIEGSKSNRS